MPVNNISCWHAWIVFFNQLWLWNLPWFQAHTVLIVLLLLLWLSREGCCAIGGQKGWYKIFFFPLLLFKQSLFPCQATAINFSSSITVVATAQAPLSLLSNSLQSPFFGKPLSPCLIIPSKCKPLLLSPCTRARFANQKSATTTWSDPKIPAALHRHITVLAAFPYSWEYLLFSIISGPRTCSKVVVTWTSVAKRVLNS